MDCTTKCELAEVEPGELTPAEKQTLAVLERKVDAGLKTFYDVGNALATIRDRRLYRESFTSFEDYLGGRWGISRPRAYQLIAAAEVVDDVSTIVDKDTLPTNEAQARELARLPAEQRANCWADYSEECEDRAVKPTPAGLRSKVDLYLADAEPFDPDAEELDEDDEPEPARPATGTVTIADATILGGDCLDRLRELPDESVNCCVTSPPYYKLRDYGVDGQVGLEETPEEYVAKLVEVFAEVRRVLKGDGTLWVVIADSYASGGMSNPSGKSTLGGGKDRGAAGYSISRRIPAGLKPKDLIGIPWMLAFALRGDGWYLRQDCIWHKPNPLPSSAKDRCTTAHEYVFLLSKSEKYHFDHEAIQEEAAHPGDHQGERGDSRRGTECNSMNGSTGTHRNKRDVWTVPTKPYKGGHYAAYPPALIEPCILAGCPVGGTVLDPFSGTGTTGEVSLQHGRRYIGIELNAEYMEQSEARIGKEAAA